MILEGKTVLVAGVGAGLGRHVVEAALRADVDQIRAHVRLALREGATPREILEALEAVIMPIGGLAFRRGVQAWAAETGFAPAAGSGTS